MFQEISNNLLFQLNTRSGNYKILQWKILVDIDKFPEMKLKFLEKKLDFISRKM